MVSVIFVFYSDKKAGHSAEKDPTGIEEENQESTNPSEEALEKSQNEVNFFTMIINKYENRNIKTIPFLTVNLSD